MTAKLEACLVALPVSWPSYSIIPIPASLPLQGCRFHIVHLGAKTHSTRNTTSAVGRAQSSV
eukprot:6180973-Pleurochrysis_carterae.AAC.3